jgi:DNA-binding NarL/FixJ family response regulator
MTNQPVSLGPRERQIVELFVQGCDNAEIARELKMAPRTVKAHFNRYTSVLQLAMESNESNSRP